MIILRLPLCSGNLRITPSTPLPHSFLAEALDHVTQHSRHKLLQCRAGSHQLHMVATLLSVLAAYARIDDPRQERTFIAVKPDGVQRGLVGEIVKRFEERGYKLVAAKLIKPGREHLEKHYEDLSSKPFFAGLVQYMDSGPIFAMVWEGRDVVKMGRVMLGATNPKDSSPGTIRGELCIDVGRNVCHGSDAVDSAKREIKLWFSPKELLSYEANAQPWVYE